MDYQALMNGLTWLGGGVIALLSVIGIGGIILALLKRFFEVSDRNEELHRTNTSRETDADITALNLLAERVKTLEIEHRQINEKFSVLMAKNAALEKENEYLKRDNERLQIEVDGLRADNNKRQGRITQLEREIEDLKREFKQFFESKS